MIESAAASCGEETANALNSDKNNSVAQFLDGSGPPCLFLATMLPKEDSPRNVDVTTPVLVAHTGLEGHPFAAAGMANAGRVCYFIRTTDGPVNQDVPCDNSILFGELMGDPSAAISAMLQHFIKPVTEAMGAAGKSASTHVDGVVNSLDRLCKEINETTEAMQVPTEQSSTPDPFFEIPLRPCGSSYHLSLLPVSQRQAYG